MSTRVLAHVLTRFALTLGFGTAAHEPAVVGHYSVKHGGDLETMGWQASASPGVAARASALAAARAELAELQESAAFAAGVRQKEQSLSELRAELDYLESLSRQPKAYTLPMHDPEQPLQIPKYYSYISSAYEPRVVDFYGGPKDGAPDLSPDLSPGVQRKAQQLSQLRQELSQLQSMASPHTMQQLAAEEDRQNATYSMGAAFTPGSEFSVGWDESAVQSFAHEARSTHLVDELTAARAELAQLSAYGR